eukprot:16436734-Heterocapsa_arctica.AAC.1
MSGHVSSQKVEISRPGEAIAPLNPGRQRSNRTKASCNILSGPIGIILFSGILSAAPVDGNPH